MKRSEKTITATDLLGMDTLEPVARAICSGCGENPDHCGDARGNAKRWQDYLPIARAAIDAQARQFENGCINLEREISRFGSIGWLAEEWHLFRAGGQSVTGGHKTLKDLIMSLSLKGVRVETEKSSEV